MSKPLSYSIREPLTGDHSRMTRIYVWELPVRLTHWLMFISLLALIATGVYIHRPYLTPAPDQEGLMSLMRGIHISAGFILAISFLYRSYWSLVGNRFANWRAFFPVSRQRRLGALEMIRYYLLIRPKPPHVLGHNALAGPAYCWIWVLYGIEILTGFALLDNFLHTNPIHHFLIGWLPALIDMQWLRAIHFFGMFAFAAFFIHHIYSAVLIAKEERNGTVESIFSGYKFVPEEELLVEQAAERAEQERTR